MTAHNLFELIGNCLLWGAVAVYIPGLISVKRYRFLVCIAMAMYGCAAAVAHERVVSTIDFLLAAFWYWLWTKAKDDDDDSYTKRRRRALISKFDKVLARPKTKPAPVV